VPSIAVDTGPLVALFDGRDRHHPAARAFIQEGAEELVTNWPVVTEVCLLLDFSASAQTGFLGWAEKALTLDDQTMSDLPRIMQIIAKYADLPAAFTDASLIAMCERRGIASIATADRDFDVYRTRDRKRLRNVFLSG
jgi:predicted nucleic acid-binding protein